MGRAKIKIEKKEDNTARQSTYDKRKNGINKKARELSVLCDTPVLLLMFAPNGKPSLCTGKQSVGEFIAKYSKLTSEERTKRMTENLEALRKSCAKDGHIVNVSELLHKSKPTVEVLSEKIKFLKTQLLEAQTKLRFWNKPEEIDSLEYLHQQETSLRQSLDQIHAHKDNMMQHQQQQLMSIDDNTQIDNYQNQLQQCPHENNVENMTQHQQQQQMSLEGNTQVNNYQDHSQHFAQQIVEENNVLENNSNFGFGMGMQQHLENFPWVRNDGNMSVPVQEQDPNLQHHHMCNNKTNSLSSSFGGYAGHCGNSSSIPIQDLDPSNNPNLNFSHIVEDSNNLQFEGNWNFESPQYYI